MASETRTNGGSRISDAEIDLSALLISEGYIPQTGPGVHRNAHFTNTDPELIDAFREVKDALAPEVERLLTAYDRERSRLARPMPQTEGESRDE